jgi:hypothetical protein
MALLGYLFVATLFAVFGLLCAAGWQEECRKDLARALAPVSRPPAGSRRGW